MVKGGALLAKGDNFKGGNDHYSAKLAAMPPDEAAQKEKVHHARISASMKRYHAIKRIASGILKAEVNPNSYQQDVLAAFGYDVETLGPPTAAVMILCNMAAKAAAGDVKAAEFLFSYGGIPNMNQMIRREELEILRHKGDPKEMDIERLEAIKLLLSVPSAVE